jgi:hypothetical protein
VNPDELEIAPGFQHEELQGRIWTAETDEDLRAGLEKAFDYRGDVTIRKKDGTVIEGYLFDRHSGGTLQDSYVRVMPQGTTARVKISYIEVAGLAFTGRDTASGKSWDAWVKMYFEKKAAGEKNIEIKPETLD